MTKFHINKHGVPAPCRAKKGNCPLGGADTHFDNIEDAQAYADKTMEESYGLMGVMKEDDVNTYASFSVAEFEEQTKSNYYDEWKIRSLKKSMQESLDSLRRREKEYGISTEEIMSRKYVDVFDGIDAEEVRRWKYFSDYLEETDEFLGEWNEILYNDFKREKQRVFDFHEKSIAESKRNLMDPNLKEHEINSYLSRIESSEQAMDRAVRDLKDVERRIERYNERYSEEAKEKKRLDRMYLHEDDVKIIKKRAGLMYKTTVNNKHAHAITKQIQDLDLRLEQMSAKERAKSPSHFWSKNKEQKNNFKKYRNIFYLRNATRKDLEEAVEAIELAEVSASLHFRFNREGIREAIFRL